MGESEEVADAPSVEARIEALPPDAFFVVECAWTSSRPASALAVRDRAVALREALLRLHAPDAVDTEEPCGPDEDGSQGTTEEAAPASADDDEEGASDEEDDAEGEEPDEPDPVLVARAAGLVTLEETEDELVLGRPASLGDLLPAIRARAERERPDRRAALVASACRHAGLDPDSPLARALVQLDRAAFVPADYRAWADVDLPVPLDVGHMTESSPHAICMTLRAVDPKPGERVLVCGAKGGYLVALAAHLVGSRGRVTALDWQEGVCAHVRRTLEGAPQLAARVRVEHCPDVTVGDPEGGPWQVVILNGSVPKIPYPVLHQVDDERGRLLFFLHEGGEGSVCYLVRKNQDVVKEERLSHFRYTPIPGQLGFDTIGDIQRQYEQARRELERARFGVQVVRERSPYPLAKAFMAAFNAHEAVERHARVLKAWEALLKYLAFVGLATFDARGRPDERCAEALDAVGRRPSLGHWLSALKHTVRAAGEGEVGAVLAKDLERRLDHEAVVAAYQRLLRETGGPDDRCDKGVSLRFLLDRLVAYRNKAGEGHGPVAASTALRERAGLLLDALQVVLARLEVARQFALVHFERVEVKPGRTVVVTARRLTGCEPEVATWKRPAGPSMPEPGIHLCAGEREVLKLDPWLVFGDGGIQSDLFLFNGRGDNGRATYVTYHNGDVYPPDEQDEQLAALLARHPPPRPVTLDRAAAQHVFEALLAGMAGDGTISRAELDVLRAQLPLLGLVPAAEDVPAFVRRALEERHPGVILEG